MQGNVSFALGIFFLLSLLILRSFLTQTMQQQVDNPPPVKAAIWHVA